MVIVRYSRLESLNFRDSGNFRILKVFWGFEPVEFKSNDCFSRPALETFNNPEKMFSGSSGVLWNLPAVTDIMI